MDIKRLKNQAVIYLILAAMITGGFAIMVSGLGLIIREYINPFHQLLVVIVIFILIITFNPLRGLIQHLLDQKLSYRPGNYAKRLESYKQKLQRLSDLQEILDLIRRDVDEVLQPSKLHIYVYESNTNNFIAASPDGSPPTSQLIFPVTDPLVSALSHKEGSVVQLDTDSLPIEFQDNATRLELLDAKLFVPLPGTKALSGWLALGPRRSDEMYQSHDFEFLESLGNYTGLAVERSKTLAILEKRLYEMDVLMRVAHGVSFTTDFDDMLELIYVQTNKVIPTRDFIITLYDETTDALYHAFYLEDDIRIGSREDVCFPTDYGLESIVINTQCPLVTDNYHLECRKHNYHPRSYNLYSWMSVPMIVGAKTIGSISIAKRDPSYIYTDDQQNLLSAIAEQAAGSIEKTRLQQETEKRAHQLATLNDISFGLISNLEINGLKRQILECAAHILDSEYAYLYLVDEKSHELRLEVILDREMVSLGGEQTPKNLETVGKVVETRQPLMISDAQRFKTWNMTFDEKPDLLVDDQLIVPMQIRGQVVGVIELVNKSDGTQFNASDQDLMIAFTNQAVIALENARLYTLTDQALAERVDELSVMQQIDRELNASLEVDRAMLITLNWAMRRSEAEAGFVGMVETEGVRVMVADGFSNKLDAYLTPDIDNNGYQRLTIVGESLGEAIHAGQPVSLKVGDWISSKPDYEFLDASKQQIVVPIQRDKNSIGMILLECTDDMMLTDELKEFLSRLADHAAIAITNSQLYKEVTEANLAKSRFVSFVAHELKNPMASIKGYTELVASGVAGPINNMQSSFLSTVEANVDRMNTIVSDLNDLTKIQVGNIRLEYHTVEIGEILDDVIHSLRSEFERKRQELVIDLPQALPAVWADPSRLSQIFTNLVSNANKYTPEDGRIDIGARRIRGSTLSKGSEFVNIWIKDTGIGISEIDQEKIFQEYFRTDEAKEMSTGTGLGLNITKSLIEMQGGLIWFECPASGGTIFHVTIPLAETQ